MHTDSDIPNHPPTEATAGDTWKWKKSSSHYPASDGWVLSYSMQSGNNTITITGVADGDDHLVVVPAATTAAYVAGIYAFQEYFTKAATGERYTTDIGNVDVKFDFATEPGSFDGRSHARKTLDAIEAVIEGRATRDDASYSIAGRALSRMPIDDLLRFRKEYRAEVKAELRDDDRRHGRAPKNRIITRFKG